MSDILDRAAERSAPTNTLTQSQESELVADIELLFMTWLVLVRTRYEEIVRDYRFSKREACSISFASIGSRSSNCSRAIACGCS